MPQPMIDANGGRDHGALARKNRPDRRAFSVVAVRHDGDVLEHEWHRSHVKDCCCAAGSIVFHGRNTTALSLRTIA